MVTGPPRSGTSLVTRVLASASGIAPPIPECNAVTNQIDLFHRWALYTDKDRLEAWFGTEGERLEPSFRRSVQLMLTSLMDSSPKLKSYERVVLKDPDLVHILESAELLLPRSTQFIVTFRNPLALVASLKSVRAQQETRFDLQGAADYVMNYCWSISRIKARADSDRWLFFKYEDLLDLDVSPIEKFVGQEVDLDKMTPIVRPKNGDPTWTRLMTQPINTDANEVTLSRLSRRENKYLRSVFAGVLDAWGYNEGT